MSKIKDFFCAPYRAASLLNIVASFCIALTGTVLLLLILLRTELIPTVPTELMGCLAHHIDLPISNRLASVTIAMAASLAFFHFSLAALSFRTRCDIAHSLFSRLYLRLNTRIIDGFHAVKTWSEREYVMPLLWAVGLSWCVFPAVLTAIRASIGYFGNISHLALLDRSGKIFSMFHWLPPMLTFSVGLFLPGEKIIKRYLLFPIQTILLLFYVVILPMPFIKDGQISAFFPIRPVFWFLVFPFIALGLADCTYPCFASKKKRYISPFTLLAVLFGCLLHTGPIPEILPNLYEFGSRIPEYWMVREGWSMLFKDMYITYGLWDYAIFWLYEVFTGELTATAFAYGEYLLQVVVLTYSFLGLSAALPLPIAFLIVLILGYNVATFIAACFALLLAPTLLRQPMKWIFVWTLMSAILPFARIPQGTVVVVASIPLFVWQVVALYRQNRRSCYYALGVVGIVAMLFLFGPLSGYFWGLMRIYSDTAKVNAPWAANDWLAWGVNLLKAAIIIAPLLAWVIAILIVRSHKNAQSKRAAFAVFSIVATYAFCLVSYGFSRTDYESSARQYQVFLSILPVLMIGTIVYIRTWRTTLSSVIAFLIFFWVFDTFQLVSFNLFSLPRDTIASLSAISTFEKHDFQDAADFKMPHVGYGKFPSGYLEESANLKKHLDRILQPDETFLDMTMVGLHYFSSQRRVFTEYPVYYTIPGDTPQYRTINTLRKHNIALSLLEPEYFDETPSSLRAHYLYRYALLNGLPFKISERQTLLMPPRYFKKIGEPLPDLCQTFVLLDEQFPQKDLKWLPQVWGRGYQKFAKELTHIRKLDIITPDERQPLQKTLPLNPAIRGLGAGLLALDVETSEQLKISISWENELGVQSNRITFLTNGKKTVIVPLDASPRWLLSRRISSLTLQAEVSPTQAMMRQQWKQRNHPLILPLLKGMFSITAIPFSNRITALSEDPMLFFELPEEAWGKPLYIRLVIDAPITNQAQVFFHKQGEQYSEENSIRMSYTKGRNELFFYIPRDSNYDELRIDPGNRPGDYVIHALEIKIIPDDNAPEFGIKRAALMQRRMIKELGLDKIAFEQ